VDWPTSNLSSPHETKWFEKGEKKGLFEGRNATISAHLYAFLLHNKPKSVYRQAGYSIHFVSFKGPKLINRNLQLLVPLSLSLKEKCIK